MRRSHFSDLHLAEAAQTVMGPAVRDIGEDAYHRWKRAWAEDSEHLLVI